MKKILGIFAKIIQFMCLVYASAWACLFLGLHTGVLGLLAESYDPIGYAFLLRVLYVQHYLSLSSLYNTFKQFVFDSDTLPALTLNIIQHPPTNSRALEERLSFFMKARNPKANIDAMISDPESVHATSITHTALTSVQALQARYPNRTVFSIESAELRGSLKHRQHIEQALRIFDEFSSIRHAVTQLSLHDLNTLVWTAVLDDSPDTWGQHATEEYRSARIESYVNTLSWIVDQAQTRKIKNENTLCFTGIYTTLLEVLSHIHPDVMLIYDNINEIFINRLAQVFETHVEASTVRLSEEDFIEANERVTQIQQAVEQQMIEEFSHSIHIERIQAFSSIEMLHILFDKTQHRPNLSLGM